MMLFIPVVPCVNGALRCTGGVCTCNTGYSGSDCCSCSSGYYQNAENNRCECMYDDTSVMTNIACIYDNCSNTAPCSIGVESCTDGVCACNDGYTGPDCCQCADRYFRDPSSGQCTGMPHVSSLLWLQKLYCLA